MNDSRSRAAHAALEWILAALSFYIIPICIGLASLAAVFLWDEPYSANPDQSVEFRVLAQADSGISMMQARAQMASAPLTKYFDTRLSEAPIWLSFQTKAAPASGKVVEFPSRHAVEISCWDANSQRLLGHSIGELPDGQISPVKAGYALKLDQTGPEIICRTSFVGPARLTVDLWSPAQLDISTHSFHRKSGLLDGGLLVLSVFILTVALINRQKLYLIFGIWLLLGLRVSATSGGWDMQWLNHSVPAEWITLGRSVTLACYALMTLTLYRAMFQDELNKTRYAAAINVSHWLCIPMLASALLMPRSLFIPTMWFFAGPGLILMTLSLATIVIRTRSRVAFWYGASLAVTFLSSLSEILAAAYGIKGLVGTFNSVTAALASSLLTSIAIAEQMRQEHAQRLQAQAELAHTYEAMPIGLFTLDRRGRFMSVNPALLRMLGPDVLANDGNTWQQYFVEGAWTQLHQMVHDKERDEMEIRGNPTRHITESKRFLVKATLANDRIEGSLQDVTDKSKAAEDLLFLANHDPLTKALNRRGIEKALNVAITTLAETKARVALAYLDLDRFKLINDLFGHAVGDQVLQQVCDRVSAMLARDHRFGRVGGDEFVIVFPQTPIALASVMCRGIIDSISTLPYRVGENAFNVRGSIGLIEISRGMRFNDAISTADRACREAKAGHTDGLVVYEKNALAFEQHEAELKLMALLATNSATDGLYLEMQPIMSLTAPHDSLNFEVLLRMRDPAGQMVRTDRLIAAGEASGRMGMIDRWVLSTTLAWLNTHHSQLQNTKFVCMNLSGASLNDEKFLQEVYIMLEQNRHIVGQLCLEITESVALHDLENTRRFVNKVRGYGAKVALDDFGAGYTSFSYLKEFKADLLKIDGSFIVDMNHHPANIAIVEAIMNLARNLGMKVIAEWAEDNATVQTLTEIGVDYVQGFAVARPQHPDKLLTARSSASFIQDKELASFVDLIGGPAPMTAPLDLFSIIRTDNMH
jgi:diguanylate cyclase (GGDEF)-like protein